MNRLTTKDRVKNPHSHDFQWEAILFLSISLVDDDDKDDCYDHDDCYDDEVCYDDDDDDDEFL